MAVIAKGKISFGSKISEALTCSCGNDPMDSGFELVAAPCESIHYECARCGAIACVDYEMRIISNEEAR